MKQEKQKFKFQMSRKFWTLKISMMRLVKIWNLLKIPGKKARVHRLRIDQLSMMEDQMKKLMLHLLLFIKIAM